MPTVALDYPGVAADADLAAVLEGLSEAVGAAMEGTATALAALDILTPLARPEADHLSPRLTSVESLAVRGWQIFTVIGIGCREPEIVETLSVDPNAVKLGTVVTVRVESCCIKLCPRVVLPLLVVASEIKPSVPVKPIAVVSLPVKSVLVELSPVAQAAEDLPVWTKECRPRPHGVKGHHFPSIPVQAGYVITIAIVALVVVTNRDVGQLRVPVAASSDLAPLPAFLTGCKVVAVAATATVIKLFAHTRAAAVKPALCRSTVSVVATTFNPRQSTNLQSQPGSIKRFICQMVTRNALH